MPTKTAHAAKRDTLNVRIKPEVRNLIDRAALLLGKSRTDFLLEAGRSAAENALLEPDGRTKQNIPLENCGLVRIQVGELHHLVHDLANANSVAQLLVDEPLIDWFWLSVRPSSGCGRAVLPE